MSQLLEGYFTEVPLPKWNAAENTGYPIVLASNKKT
jgi:hypothetical protein